jgi:hypothetical protein
MPADLHQAGAGQPLDAVLHAVSEEPWSELVLWGVPEYSPTLAILPRLAAGGLQRRDRAGECLPVGAASSAFDDYVEGLNRRDRHELRRKLRRLYSSGDVFSTPVSRCRRWSRTGRLRGSTPPAATKGPVHDRTHGRFFRRMALTLAEQNRCGCTAWK